MQIAVLLSLARNPVMLLQSRTLGGGGCGYKYLAWGGSWVVITAGGWIVGTAWGGGVAWPKYHTHMHTCTHTHHMHTRTCT